MSVSNFLNSPYLNSTKGIYCYHKYCGFDIVRYNMYEFIICGIDSYNQYAL